MLISYEMNYSIIEKDCLVVIFASQNLRHYMLAHTTGMVTKIDSLKYLLSKAVLIGSLAKWVMILSELIPPMLKGRLSKDKQLLIN